MAKTKQLNHLLIQVVLLSLLSFNICAFLLPNANAASITDNSTMLEELNALPKVDTTRSAIAEKGLSILSNVVGVDTGKYSINSGEYAEDTYIGVVPQENVRYTLEANGSKLDMLYTFANGNLRMIHVLESEGSPLLTKTATRSGQVLGNKTLQVVDVQATAENFLNSYQSQSGKQFYGKLVTMLKDIDASKNATKIVDNVKLEVNSTSHDSITFRWLYTSNGIDAPSKCVALSYKNGFLKYFIDNWDLYKIGSTDINLSEEEAIGLAMNSARAFSWKIGSDNSTVSVKNFTVSNAMIWETIFYSNLYADNLRNEDPLMLYPMRHVWVSLDKFYPGNVYGIEVYIWADTKSVCQVKERFSTLDPPANLVATAEDYTIEPLTNQVSTGSVNLNSMTPMWIALPAFVTLMIGIIPVILVKRRNLPKHSFKTGGIVLCLLIASTILLIPISAVNAEPIRRTLIWGSESTGDTSYYGSTGRKTADEIYRQQVTSNALCNYFNDDGYDTDNYQGSGSIAAQIVNNISDSETNYAQVAVVDFDHGVGNPFNFPGGVQNEFHYMFEDNIGTRVNGQEEILNAVYDMNISNRTTGKTFFALINRCLSACIDDTVGDYVLDPSQGMVKDAQGQPTDRARGMPFAWTHRIVNWKGFANFSSSEHISLFGYSDPDTSQYCYIGFPFGSAALDQTITGIAPIYATWLENFFWYALSFDISINHALDHASLRNFDSLFGESDLYQGFDAVWPMWNAQTQEWDASPYPESTLVVYGNGNIHLYQYFVHDVVDVSTYGYAWVTNEENLEGGSNDGNYATMEADYPDSHAFITADLLKDTAHGNIYLYGDTNGYYSHVYVYVSNDYSNWDCAFDNYVYANSPSWLSVGSWSSNFKYISIAVYNQEGDYYSILDVDSVLVIPSPPQAEYQYVYNATEYENGGVVYDADYINGSYYDGVRAHIHCSDSPDRADVIGTLNEEATGGGHVYVYGCSGPGGYLSDMYVYVSNDNNNWYQVGSMQTITATSPYWIDAGTYGSTFRYVRIVGYDSANSVCLYLDCVHVTH